MGHHESSKMIVPAVLITVLFMAQLSSATPTPTNDVPEKNGAVGPLTESSLTALAVTMEKRMRTAILAYLETQNPTGRQYIEWVLHSKNRREMMPKELIDVAREYIPLTDFWSTVDQYVTYQYNYFKSQKNAKKSFFKRLISSRSASTGLSYGDLQKFEQIQTLIDNVVIKPKKTLTAILLSFRGIDPLDGDARKAFERAIIKGLKTDMILGINAVAMREISHALVLNSRNNEAEHFFAENLLKNPVLKDILKRPGYEFLKSAYQTDFSIALKHPNVPKTPALHKVGSVDVGLNAYGRPKPKAKSSFVSCQNLRAPRRRRRSSSKCLLSKEEYREVVKKIKKEGGTTEVLDTEKFLDLLERVTAEDSAAKREQLLELGAALSKDPEVTLEGDYVAEFKDVVQSLDETVPREMLGLSHSQLPENPFGKARLQSEFHEFPLDHLNPREIYSRHPADRISTQPLDILHEPTNIHGPVIHPAEFGGMKFHAPMTEFHTEFKPLSVPKFIHPVEIAPVEIASVPEFKLSMPEFKLPMIGRG